MVLIADTYKIKSSNNLAQKLEYRRASVLFDDGYEQRSIIGINSLKETWDITFTDLSTTQKNDLITIMNNTRSVYSVQWVAPGQVSAKNWLVLNPSVIYYDGIFWEISCTMKEIVEI